MQRLQKRQEMPESFDSADLPWVQRLSQARGHNAHCASRRSGAQTQYIAIILNTFKRHAERDWDVTFLDVVTFFDAQSIRAFSRIRAFPTRFFPLSPAIPLINRRPSNLLRTLAAIAALLAAFFNMFGLPFLFG
jgi:hypothetical protein